MQNKQVFACGDNDYGQLGLGDYSNVEHATLAEITYLPGNVRSVAAGGSHTIFLMQNKQVFACGNNSSGQLGLGNDSNNFYKIPQRIISLPGKVRSVVAGSGHTIFLMDNGTVFVCGDNSSGQLGSGYISNGQYLPTKISFELRVQSVAAGAHHSFFITEDGSAFSCGNNDNGQLGLGNDYKDNNITSPTKIHSLPSEVESIAAGGSHSIFRMKSGQFFACGNNTSGQLGLGPWERVYTPKEINPLFL